VLCDRVGCRHTSTARDGALATDRRYGTRPRYDFAGHLDDDTVVESQSIADAVDDLAAAGVRESEQVTNLHHSRSVVRRTGHSRFLGPRATVHDGDREPRMKLELVPACKDTPIEGDRRHRKREVTRRPSTVAKEE
jgi:hypothetical protein